MAKLNYFDFIHENENYRGMQGVHHEKGLKIASNGRFLLAVKENYDPSLEGVTLSKNFEKIEIPFPNWQKVVPSMSNYVEVPFKLTEKQYKRAKTFVTLQRKVNCVTKHKNVVLTDSYYKIAENCIINYEWLKQVFEVTSNFNVKCYIDSEKPNERTVVFKTDDDTCIFLVMPLFNAEIEGFNEIDGVYFPNPSDVKFKIEDAESDTLLSTVLYRINKETIFNKLKNNMPLDKTEEKILEDVKTFLENYAN